MPKTTWRPQPAHSHTCTSTRGMILIGLPWPEVNHPGAHFPHISTNGEPYTLTRKAWWSRRSSSPHLAHTFPVLRDASRRRRLSALSSLACLRAPTGSNPIPLLLSRYACPTRLLG